MEKTRAETPSAIAGQMEEADLYALSIWATLVDRVEKELEFETLLEEDQWVVEED